MTATAAQLRNRLVDELTAPGWLTEAWRPAFAAVPRHAFLSRFFRQTPDRSRYEAVDAGDPGALELIYSNSVLPTQLDGDDARWEQARRDGPIEGVPTCSSTQPGLMAIMLDALDVADGHRVLEVGTGTGYNAALIAHRLGSPLVTTVDIDAGLVRRAREALTTLGYAVTVVATDGETGYPDNAPYDRIIATCAVPEVPRSWLAQTRPGGVILTNLHREIGGGLLLRLTVDEHGAASGHLLDDYGSFMPLRSCPTAQTSALVRAAAQATGHRHETHLPGPLTDDGEAWTALVALMLPDVARLDLDTADGAVQWLVHPGGSWAYYHIGTRMVEQGGARRLWTEVEDLYSRWVAHGKPSRPHIGVTLGPAGQQVWLNEPTEIIN